MSERFSQEIFSPREYLSRAGFSDQITGIASGAARVGGRKILKRYGLSPEELHTTLKPEAGMSPVTAADLESEEAIKRIIHTRLFPDHTINAEESGELKGKNNEGESNIVWYVDPLDGTISFTREQKYSSVGIAVYEKGQPKLATICRPFQRETLVAESGKGAWVFPLDDHLDIVGDGKRLSVSANESLKDGIIYIDGVFNHKTAAPTLKMLERLSNSVGNFGLRSIGTNIGQQAEVAEGRGDLTLTTAVGGFYDLAAGSLIIEEAGGRFCGLDGQPINSNTQVAIGGNKQIIEQVLPILQKSYEGYQGFK